MKTFLELANETFLLGEDTGHGRVVSKTVNTDTEILMVTFEPAKFDRIMCFENLQGNLVEL